jgi:ferredoxin
MAVFITDACINCGACIDECPVEAIVDEDENPTGEEYHFVTEDKCVECVGHHDIPACATACPTEGCIVWSEVGKSPEHRTGIDDKRADKTPVVED